MSSCNMLPLPGVGGANCQISWVPLHPLSLLECSNPLPWPAAPWTQSCLTPSPLISTRVKRITVEIPSPPQGATFAYAFLKIRCLLQDALVHLLVLALTLFIGGNSSGRILQVH